MIEETRLVYEETLWGLKGQPIGSDLGFDKFSLWIRLPQPGVEEAGDEAVGAGVGGAESPAVCPWEQ